MTEEPGRRERKKQRTRQALIQAALRLFEKQGYEETTVAQIAEAADLSTRTFFLHFPTKEDVLLANAQVRVDIGLNVIAERRPGEPAAGVLARAVERMIENTLNSDLSDGVAGWRAILVASSSTVRARLVQQLLSAHADLSEALLQTYSDELDEVDTAGLIGGLIGAIGAAGLTSVRRGDTPDQVRVAMSRAADLIVAAAEHARPPAGTPAAQADSTEGHLT
ncbi:TetR/AcrR family transcriptional regulator [Nonomuraea sp. KC401]|uniref:TetR/AcrR family transcriptional regulator n=1 Tax=unclassified Nonomuraea TaxID=2593643 RepID=UPI0010FD79BD|nr:MULTISPECIES: TetR/AcrR family transcriptional regulator [unclassified Nonomuraea]NBE92349.1 TetR family transcriptional regulator [Nonomuraea sp. K271]TLF81849.1 TetR/AcrR family transcriptional regulator [Nonomuraea sp. KC401]